MSEEKTIRLAKAASEFNVAMSHIVDLLTTKGFSVDAKPTTKLSEEMYTLLLKEFGKEDAEDFFDACLDAPAASGAAASAPPFQCSPPAQPHSWRSYVPR